MPAPAGFGYADTREGEPKRLEPVTLPPTWEGPPMPRRHQIAILDLIEACKWTEGDPGKLAALHAVFFDNRPIAEVAETAKCSKRTFYRRLGELRELLAVWREEHEERGE